MCVGKALPSPPVCQSPHAQPTRFRRDEQKREFAVLPSGAGRETGAQKLAENFPSPKRTADGVVATPRDASSGTWLTQRLGKTHIEREVVLSCLRLCSRKCSNSTSEPVFLLNFQKGNCRRRRQKAAGDVRGEGADARRIAPGNQYCFFLSFAPARHRRTRGRGWRGF